MADLDRIKRNVSKMAEQGAPEADIDGYISSEGTTVDAVRAHKLQSAPQAPKYEFNPIESAIGGATQGYTMGTSDEAAAALGMGTQEQMQEKLRQAQEQHPYAYTGGEIAGGVASALTGPIRAGVGAVSAGIKMMPKTAQWLQKAGKLANENIGTRAVADSAVGGLSGGAYGFATGSGNFEQRAERGAESAAYGVFGGPLFRPVVGAVSRVGSSAVDASKTMYNKAKTIFGSVQSSQVSAPMATTSTGTAIGSVKPAEIIAETGKAIDLPRGAASKNVDLMRYEESARQGLLGPEMQSAMGAIDENVKRQASDIAETMTAGKTSEELLTSGIEKFRNRFEKQKAVAGKLMEARNNVLAKASVYKGYTRDTLGAKISELAKTPDFKTLMPTEAGKQIKERITYLNKLMQQAKGGKFEKPLDFVELAAWRKSLNGFKAGTQESVYAKKLASTYDEWLDDIADTAFAQGDDGLVSKIKKANSFYKDFKDKFSTNTYKGQSQAVENLLTKKDYTPAQAVNMIFGKNTDGVQYTAQSVGRILKTLPEAKRAQAASDFRAGLIARAKENATSGDKLSLPIFRNGLIKMQKSEAYRLHLKDETTDKVLTALVKDLGDYIESTGRRDVISPSGGAVSRALQGIINGSGALFGPVGGRVISEIGAKSIQNASKAKARIEVEKTINEFLDEAIKETNKKAFSAPSAAFGGALTVTDKNEAE